MITITPQILEYYMILSYVIGFITMICCMATETSEQACDSNGILLYGLLFIVFPAILILLVWAGILYLFFGIVYYLSRGVRRCFVKGEEL